jgi:hypothetical protein
MALKFKKDMKIKILDKEYEIKVPTVYEVQRLRNKEICNMDDLTYFLNDIYGEELAYVLFELFDFEGILHFIEKTLPSIVDGEDIEIETPNNFKKINAICNAIKKGKQEYDNKED